MDRLRLILFVFLTALCSAAPVRATIVRFETTLGDFDVRLFNVATPLYVANLLMYIDAHRYDGTFIHRSVPRFIIQGGGFHLDGNTIFPVEEFPTVNNEFGISNIRGTFSMAKQDGDPDSASSNWFPNLSHNTANLDNQNGGFTVFAAVVGNGMAVIDAIGALPRYDVFPSSPNDAFNTVPILNIPGTLADNLIIVIDVYVRDIPDGDYNLDGVVDGYDLAIWSADYSRLWFVGGDFNDDKEMNGSDLAIWETNYGKVGGAARYTTGDSNGDAVIDGIDFLNWQRGSGGTTDAAADGDGDAQVSGMDFLLWQRNYGATAPTPLVTVPEPATVALMLLGLFAKPQAWRRACRGRSHAGL